MKINNVMKPKHSIITLPHEHGVICFTNLDTGCIPRNNRSYQKNIDSGIADGTIKPQHLYVLSDDEISGGDWFYNLLTKTIEQATDWIYVSNCKKIIATTDTTITNDYSTSGVLFVPQIHQAFIELYAEQYDKGNIITEVDVEYEVKASTDSLVPEIWNELKINLDNTINISLIKDSWNRDELPNLIINICRRYQTFKGYNALDFQSDKSELVKFIKENS